MDFRTALEKLGAQITTQEIAEALGVSYHSVRQARLREGASGYRSPPENWRSVVARLARERGGELNRLADELER